MSEATSGLGDQAGPDQALEEVSDHDSSLAPVQPVQESDPNTQSQSPHAPGRSVVSYIHPYVTAYI